MLLRFLGNEGNNRALTFLLAVVVAIVAGSWTFYEKVLKPSSPDTTPSVQIDGDVTGDAQIVGTAETVVMGNQTIIKQTVTDYRDQLIALQSEKIAALETADVADRQILQSEIDVLRGKLKNIESAYAKSQEAAHLLRLEISSLKGSAPIDQIEAAQSALYEGRFADAQTQIDAIRAALADNVEAAAKAAYISGELAEERVDWHQAELDFETAARLNPTFKHLHTAGEYKWRMGAYTSALNLGEDLIEAAKTQFPNDLTKLATALNNHALSLQALGHYDQAEQRYLQAIEIDIMTIGEEHPEYAKRLNNHAGLYDIQGKYAQAEPLYLQSIEIGKKTIGEEHPDYASRLNNLALLYHKQGKYDQAEPLYLQALDIAMAALGADHPTTKTFEKNYQKFLQSKP